MSLAIDVHDLVKRYGPRTVVVAPSSAKTGFNAWFSAR